MISNFKSRTQGRAKDDILNQLIKESNAVLANKVMILASITICFHTKHPVDSDQKRRYNNWWNRILKITTVWLRRSNSFTS